MQIVEVDSENISLKKFKETEWPEADKEHYGVAPADFFTEHKHTLTAQDGDRILGYVKVIASGGVGRIDSLIVGKAYRGQGVARSLLSAADEKLKGYGCHKVMLETGAGWEARKVYEKLGYTVRALLPNHFHKQEFVLMEKELS